MWIEIDDELARQVETRTRLHESREEVVSRLLEVGIRASSVPRAQAADKAGPRTRQMRAGTVPDLIRAGLIQPGDEVTYRQVRKGVTHTATIDDGGRLHTTIGVEASLSSAAQKLVGFNVNGWTAWVHVRSGKTLSALRGELPT